MSQKEKDVFLLEIPVTHDFVSIRVDTVWFRLR